MPDIPVMLTPRMGNRLPATGVWAADTGIFGAPEKHDNEQYLGWLEKRLDGVDRCLFATAPDVVGDAAATLALSAPMLPRIRALGFPAALVAQDGLELLDVPWSDFDVLFVGGSTEWKLGAHAARLVNEAKLRGKWVHMGRVNGRGRLEYAESIGCDSADGTVLVFDRSRPVQKWVDYVNANPSLWRPA